MKLDFKDSMPIFAGVVLFFSLQPFAFAQGFLQMPDTTEVPEYERESMLLDLDIPPVRDRDPDPEAGPRLNVKEFKLQGLVEYPELGITREGLIKRVESIRFDLMSEGEMTDSGYTLDELGEISDLMAEIEKESEGEHVGALEVQKLVFLIREQRRRRGVTLGMIETVADTITNFYREKGFILAKAYIPQQKVRDGVVNLTLLLGELGEITVENRKRVSDNLVARAFKRDLNKPVTSWKVEESLYLINDIPGLSAQGFFSPGSQVGDTRLSLNITEEKYYSFNMRTDNHGSESTSENRAYVDAFLHNPLGIGDELYLAVLNSYSPDAATYGSIRYSLNLWNPRVSASIGASTNDFVSFDIAAGQRIAITGESSVADASLSYKIKRSRVKNYSVSLSFMDITSETGTRFQSEIDTGNIDETAEDVQKVSLNFNFDILVERWQHLYLGSVGVHSAQVESPDPTSDQNVILSEDEAFFSYNISMLSFPEVPFTNYKTRVLLKSAGQYSGKALSNLNQMSFTGPTRARGFSVNGLQADDGIFIGVDWLFSLPKFENASIFGEEINKVITPFVFADSSYVTLYAIGDAEGSDEGQIGNVGAGLKIDYKKFSAMLTASTVVQDNVIVGETPIDTRPKNLYFEMQYAF